MKTSARVLFGLGLCLVAFGQPQSPISPVNGPSLDKVKLEAYLRNLEVLPPQVNVAIADPKPSSDLPGFNEVAVHLSYKGNALDETYYVSNDGQKIVKGQVFDINKSPFQANLDKIKTDQQPAFGAPANAPVSLVVFGDFECPYCKEEATVLRQNIPATFKDKVRVYFMDFPLDSIHPWAHVASLAGRCIYHQSQDSFWKYHDWIYQNQTSITPENFSSKLLEWAGTSGVDSVQLGRCVENKVTEPEVSRTQAMGRSLGIDGTPTLFLNGRQLKDQNAQWPALQQLITFEIDHQAKLAEEKEKCCTVEIPKIGK